MKVKALRNLLYKGHIYHNEEEFEMDAEKAKYWQEYGGVKILNDGNIELEFTPAEGLPDLVTESSGKKNK